MVYKVLLNIICLVISFAALFESYFVAKTMKKITIYTLFYSLYAVIYGIVPIVFVANSKLGIIFDFSDNGMKCFAIWELLSLIFLVIFVLFSRRDLKRLAKKEKNIKGIYESSYLQLTLIISFIIGFMCFLYTIYMYGGVNEYIIIGEYLRGNEVESRVPSLITKLQDIILIVSYASAVLIKKTKKYIVLNSVIFIISTLASVIILLSGDGRMITFMYVLTLLFIITDVFEENQKLSKKFIFLSIFLLLFVAGILKIDDITYYLRYGKVRNTIRSDNLLYSILRLLSFIYRSGQVAVNQYINDYRHFKYLLLHDVGCGLFAWLPRSVRPKEIINIWEYNTKIVFSLFTGLKGQQPTSVVTTCIYDLGVSGTVILSIFWSKILLQIEKVKKMKSQLIVTVSYSFLAVKFLRLVMYASLYYFIQSLFSLFIFIVLYYCIRSLSERGVTGYRNTKVKRSI